MPLKIRRLRQAVGLIYILMYISIFFAYVFIFSDDQSWVINLKFTITVFVWFILSLAVKVSMFMNRLVELLNLVALVAFVSIGFTYNPQPGHHNSVENFVYYLYLIGGPACDAFDFVYEAVPRRPEN
ncbi:Phosphatidate cytidylyltransferase (EC [Olavius algarvensis associated proteobacterium Delta 3]|nr:Phosphatidate cytidylyltransferase (EC [Olavius algarvensis associated proteobacterium Delta 3]CAB5098601.1 Phosphatidate cytidylyltransferase (EC [Olavius algarvensis associated proteobacterium Delta 3]